MSKSITIRVSDEVHQELQARAAAEDTTVTALLTEAALRDARLSAPTPRADRFLAEARGAFAQAFGGESQSHAA